MPNNEHIKPNVKFCKPCSDNVINEIISNHPELAAVFNIIPDQVTKNIRIINIDMIPVL